MHSTTIRVPEVHCQHCVSAIEGALEPLDGVATATVDLDETAVTVTWDPTITSREQLVAVIKGQGYDVPTG